MGVDNTVACVATDEVTDEIVFHFTTDLSEINGGDRGYPRDCTRVL